jgi:ABC-type branched-subunit amino acid transport system ATPase component/branched-subunit amino acid ABC-type transport system permease component
VDVLTYAILGLGPGAVYALTADGLLVSYRVSGVINFAQAALGMIGAYAFYELHTLNGWPLGLALVIGILVGALAGGLMQLLIMQPLRNGSNLAKLVATLGVLTFTQYILTEIYGNNLIIVPAVFPSSILHFGADVSQDRLWLLGVGVAGTVILGLAYRFSHFGRATSAVAENPVSAAAVGIAPQRIALFNWGLGGGLAALGMILVAPVVGLQPASLSLLVLPALAAALVGGFSSFPLTLLGGLVIGILQGEAARYLPNVDGLSPSVPFFVILVVMLARGRALPTRGDIVARLPSVGSGKVRIVPVVLLLAVGIWVLNSVDITWVDAITTSLIFAMLGLSLVVVVGLAGQLSLAQYMLAGLGGWAAARLVVNYGIPYEIAFLAGMAASVAGGLVASLPALRARGPSLAITTLGLGVILQNMLLGTLKWTGGVNGNPVGNLKLFGINFGSILNPVAFGVLVLVLVVICGLVVSNIRRGNSGRRLIAVRSNERAAAALGVSVPWVKCYAFAVSSVIAGLAGCLLAFRSPVADFSTYDVMSSINVLASQVIGGIGHVTGSVFAAGFAPGGVLQRPFSSYQNFTQILSIISGALVVVTVISDPDGLATGRGRRWVAAGVRAAARPLARSLPALPRPAWAARTPSAPTADAVPEQVPGRTLTVTGLGVRFGGVRALDGVSLEVKPGQITALIGPNGAGKTTLIDAVTGFVKPAAGTIALDGQRINGWSPTHRARNGIGRSFQSLELFDDLSVTENLGVASDPSSRRSWWTDPFWSRPRPLSPAGMAAVRDLDLTADLDHMPEDLSYGLRRLVAIARALAARPSILLLDEPSAGLDEVESIELGTTIRRVAKEWGIGILLIEHDMGLVMKISDQVVVIDFGKQIATGTPQQVQSNPEVIAAYLGKDHAASAADAELVRDEPALGPALGPSAGPGGPVEQVQQ